MRARILTVRLPIFAVLAALVLAITITVGRPGTGQPTVAGGGLIQGDPSNSNVWEFHTVSAPPDWAMPVAPSGMEPGDTIHVQPNDPGPNPGPGR